MLHFFRCLQQQRLAAKRGRISPPPVPQGFACLLLTGSILAEQAEVAGAAQNLAALADDAGAVLAGVKLGGVGVVAHGRTTPFGVCASAYSVATPPLYSYRDQMQEEILDFPKRFFRTNVRSRSSYVVYNRFVNRLLDFSKSFCLCFFRMHQYCK